MSHKFDTTRRRRRRGQLLPPHGDLGFQRGIPPSPRVRANSPTTMSAPSKPSPPAGTTAHTATPRQEPQDDSRLDALLDRISQLTSASSPSLVPAAATRAPPAVPTADTARGENPAVKTACPGHEGWAPTEPDTLAAAGLTDGEVEALLLKALNSRSEATGRSLCEHLKLPFRLIDPLLHSMKHDRLVAHKGAAMANDYVYQLTELGRERAKKFAEHCTYFGAAPVPLAAYIESVKRQRLADQHPTEDDLQRAFEDLLIEKTMLTRLRPAINSGRGLFLYGPPGNGKTSIPERITKALREHTWRP